MTPKEIPTELPETEWTEISVEREVRFGKPEVIKFKVPFTATEVINIKAARDEIETLRLFAFDGGSTIVREIYG